MLGIDQQQVFGLFKHKSLEQSLKRYENDQSPGFYNRQYEIFTKFDEGVRIDAESMASAVPEKTAKFIAHYIFKTFKPKTIIDGLCGIGSTSIQFAKFGKVIAVDINQQRLEYARQNAQVYGIDQNIEFMNADILTQKNQLKGDLIFFNPNWRMAKNVIDLKTMAIPNFQDLIAVGCQMAKTIVFCLPCNIDPNQIAQVVYENSHLDTFVKFVLLFSQNKIQCLLCFIGKMNEESNNKAIQMIQSKLELSESQTITLVNLIESINSFVWRKIINGLQQTQTLNKRQQEKPGDLFFQILRTELRNEWMGVPVLYIKGDEAKIVQQMLNYFKIYYTIERIDGCDGFNQLSDSQKYPILSIDGHRLNETWRIGKYLCQRYHKNQDPEINYQVNSVCLMVDEIKRDLKDQNALEQKLLELVSKLGQGFGMRSLTLADFYVFDLLSQIHQNVQIPEQLQFYWNRLKQSVNKFK